MPVSWRIKNDLVWLESSEQATVDDWREAVDAVLAAAHFRPGMGLIHDRRLARVPYSQEVRAAIDHIVTRSTAIGKARWALVVSGTAGYGMGRMAQMLIEGTSVTLHVCRDLAEAEDWVRGGA